MAWLDPNWKYRVKIIGDKDEVPSTQTDKPFVIDFSDFPADFFANVKSDGGDIRVTQADGETQQAFGLVFLTVGSSIGEGKFKASSQSSSVDNEFYVYYGNSAASAEAVDSTYGAENVWDSDFIGSYSFQEADPSSDYPLDSTANGNDFDASANLDADDAVSGQLPGNAWRFNNSAVNNEWANITSSPLAGLGTMSVSFWFNHTETNQFYRMFHHGDNSHFDVAIGSPDTDIIWFVREALGVGWETVGSVTKGVWNYITLVASNIGTTDKRCVYVNGVNTFSSSVGLTTNIPSSYMRVGANSDASQCADHIMDEMWITDTKLTLDEHILAYNNMVDTTAYYSVGAQETNFVPQIIIV